GCRFQCNLRRNAQRAWIQGSNAGCFQACIRKQDEKRRRLLGGSAFRHTRTGIRQQRWPVASKMAEEGNKVVRTLSSHVLDVVRRPTKTRDHNRLSPPIVGVSQTVSLHVARSVSRFACGSGL